MTYSMEIRTDTPKEKYSQEQCIGCILRKRDGRGAKKICTWHHIDRRVNSNRWVWLCVSIFNREGCHEWVHAHPEEARTIGLYQSNHVNMKKQKTKKQVAHRCTYLMGKCQFCGKPMSDYNRPQKGKKR